jgi:predicted acyltransferase
MTKRIVTHEASERLSSLDFLRGLIMVALMIGETGFFQKLFRAFPNPFTEVLSTQFEHSEWHGLTFWDVILPAFMTMAGQQWPSPIKNNGSPVIRGSSLFKSS